MISSTHTGRGNEAPVKASRILLATVPFVGLAASVALLVWIIDVEQTVRAIGAANPWWLAAAAGVALVQLGMAGVRLWSLLHTAGLGATFRRSLSAVLAATTLNAILPGRGGDLAKAAFVAEDRAQVRPLIGVMLVERGVDVLMLALISCVGAAAVARWRLCGVAGLIAVAAAAGLIGLGLTHTRIRLPLVRQDVGQAAHRLLARPGRIALALLLSLVFWATNVGLFACLLRAVDAGVSLGQTASAAPLSLLTGALPISINGIGTRDAALVSLLRAYAAEPVVLAASVLYTIIGNWMLAAIGVVSLGKQTLRATRAAALHAADSSTTQA